MTETVLRNARIVLRDRVVHGDLVIRDGLIADIAASGSGRTGDDLEGDFLLPGLVELHTDHLESHYAPRPRVRWNAAAAVQAHDAQIAASGITTVFDALRVGLDEDVRLTAEDTGLLADAIGQAMQRGRLRADHFIHLRCEVSAPDVVESFSRVAGHPLARLVSLMDHTPGQRQFTSLERYRVYYQGKSGMSDADFEIFLERRCADGGRLSGENRKLVAQAARDIGMVLASHDDATAEHVAEATAEGVTLAEFPTTVDAARASREAGMKVLMGAPNIVRGGSHSGNVSAAELAAEGCLDVLSSDYVPFSLLQAACLLGCGEGGIGLAEAVALVSAHPAEAAGLADRGTIEPEKRADLVRVRMDGELPVVRTVWRRGERVV